MDALLKILFFDCKIGHDAADRDGDRTIVWLSAAHLKIRKYDRKHHTEQNTFNFYNTSNR